MNTKPKPPIPLLIIAFITLGSGILSLTTVIGGFAPHGKYMETLFPLSFINASHHIVLLTGMWLIVSAWNITKRKALAFWVVLLISAISAVLHIIQGLHYGESLVSLILCVLLIVNYRWFTVKSRRPEFNHLGFRVGTAILTLLVYGTAGFWFLDKVEFRMGFNLYDSIRETLLFITFTGDSELIPRTSYARWFLESLEIASFGTIFYTMAALFSPVLYRLRFRPKEILEARKIVSEHGNTSLDVFRTWPDKNFWFSTDRSTLISFRSYKGAAIILGGPVGPQEKLQNSLKEFMIHCHNHDWKPGFYSVTPELLPIFSSPEFKSIKVGDDAIVELDHFTMEGSSRKKMRHGLKKMREVGYSYRRFESPLTDEFLAELSDVSDEWLTLPGKRERAFTLGCFDIEYIRHTPVNAILDETGRVVAFCNEIRSGVSGEIAIDLMRHRTETMNGTMDFLFTETINSLKTLGLKRLNMGMAPMSGFQEHESPTWEERAVHNLFQHLNFLFSYRGLKQFKSKYATTWSPRYIVFRNYIDLIQIVIALGKATENVTGSDR